MNCKRLWSTIVVSFICFLLASSFVLQTSAETILQTFSVQSVAVVDAVFDTNEEEQPADLSYVQNVSVTEENPVPEAVYNRMDYVSISASIPTTRYISPFSYSGICGSFYTSSNRCVYLITENSFKRDVRFNLSGTVSVALSDSFYLYWTDTNFFFGRFLSSSLPQWGSYDLSSVSSDSFFVSEYNGAAFIFFKFSDGGTIGGEVWQDSTRILTTGSFIGTSSSEQRQSNTPITYCVYDKYVYCRTMNDKVIVLNMETRSYERSISIPLFQGVCPIVADDKYLYIFTDQTSFYKVDLDTGESVTYTYPVNHNLTFTESCNVGYVNGSFYLPTTIGFYRLYFDSDYYYDPLNYQVSPNIEVDKYINFSYQGTSDGTQNGDGFIGLDLNFGVPASYFASNEVTSVRFQSFAYSYSSSADQFVTDNVPLPYNVQMTGENLNVLATYYPKLVGQVGDLYLYNYNVIFYVDASRVDSFDISLNTYIPAQTETHWFSIPCSTLDISYYDSGGGGGSGGGSDLSQIEADLVIIQDQMSGMLTKFDDVSEGISQVENRLDEIQNILTSLPDDHESNMQEWSDNLDNNQSRLDDISSAIDAENSLRDELSSYYDPYVSAPELDPSIDANASDIFDAMENLDSGQASVLFSFIRNMWTVHPYMLGMSSVVIVLGIIGIYVRSA